MEVKHLQVKIGADKQAYENAMKGVSTSIQKHKTQFKKVGMAMTAAGGAIIGSLGLMVKGYVSAGDEVHKMALRTGFATETLSKLRYAAQIAGTDISGLEKGVKKMSKSIVDGCAGMTTYTRAFENIGLEVKSLIDLSPEQQFMKIALAIAEVQNPTVQAAAAMDIFGRAGTALLPLFKEGKIGMQDLMNAADDMGIVFDQKAANKAAALADAQVDLKVALGGLSKSIITNIIPSITNFVTKMSETISKVTEWAKAHPGLISLIVKVTGAVGALMLVLGPLTMMLPGLVTLFKALKVKMIATKIASLAVAAANKILGTSFKVALGPIGLIVAAITGLIAVGYLVVKNWDEISKFLSKIWTGIAKTAKKVFDGIKKFVLDWMKKIVNVLTKVPILKKFAKQWKAGLDEARNELDTTGKHVSKRNKEMAKAFVNTVKKSDLFKKAVGFLGEKLKFLGGLTKDTESDVEDLGFSFDDVKDKTKTWIDFIKDKGILTIKQKRDRIKELEGYVEDLDKAYEDGKLSLEDYTTAMAAAKDEIDGLQGVTETWRDFLKNHAILTIQEKRDRVEELEGVLNDLHQAYRDGKLDAEDYKAATKAIKDEMGGLQTTIVDTAIPAVRDMTDVWEGAVDDFKGDTEGFKEDFKSKTTTATDSIKNLWNDMTDGIKTKWINELSAALQGTKNWKDALKAVWDTIKSQFFDMIAKMITKWITDFLGNITSKTKEAATDVGNSFGDLATTVEISTAQMSAALANVATALIGLIGYMAIFHGMPPVSPEKWPEREKGKGQIPGWPVAPPSPLGWQEGFEGIVRQPIWRKFGEIPEYVNIQPLSKMRAAQPAAFTGITKDIRQSSFKMNIYGPLVSTVGLSNADLEYAGDKLMRIIERKLAAKGRSL